ncbi:hypothetical protein DFH09DRAFT_1191379 [Mycena vulgaris]|nr:hypothetical protein DFH09DRAFT_1191379 [Mycena vulgaris]
MSARILTRCGRVRCHKKKKKKKKKLRTMAVMSDGDWDAIKLVLEWLVLPKGAMVKTSTTKKPMLSQTHAIFRTLQSAVKSSTGQVSVIFLSQSIPPWRSSLAQRKLRKGLYLRFY